MELTVFGATGGTGRQIVQQALDAGHRVTAVVRDPARLPVHHSDLTVLTLDVTDPEALPAALTGRDAAVSALGATSRKQAGIASSATRQILSALDVCGVRRFAAVSAAVLGTKPDDETLLYRMVFLPVLRTVLRDIYADLAEMEEQIHRSGADWTVVRPPRLLNKPLTGTYRRLIGGNVPRGHSLSRADLAHAILALLDDAATVKQVVGVAY